MACRGIFPIKEIIRQSQTSKLSLLWQPEALLQKHAKKEMFRLQASKFHRLVNFTNCLLRQKVLLSQTTWAFV